MIVRPLFDYQFRVIVIGNTMVGKSSLVRHFVEDGAPQQLSCEPTVGVDFFARTVQLSDGRRVKLTLWDTAGQEKFRSITRSYYRNAVAALIVFDVGCRASFEAVPAWHAEARRCMASEHACCLLVGQKADLPPALRRVGADEAAYMAAQLGVPYMETSAVSGLNIDATFCHLAQLVYSQFAAGSYDGKLGRGGGGVGNGNGADWDGIRVGYAPYGTFADSAFRIGDDSNGKGNGGCC
ncbi:hypothetical protein BOX15_Mlig014668g5 [Macrostomum lignano]|uniref:Ras-related protein Rab-39B n=2 Tax=Macrostomum lignano TaxID=282301 RepID=A0A267G8Z6_9PLAT|nr:hypothetical protein BOX15_Mlig014668g5 [Macrostomum lignano]